MSLGFFVCLFPSHMRCWVDVHQLSILIKLVAALHVPFLFFFFCSRFLHYHHLLFFFLISFTHFDLPFYLAHFGDTVFFFFLLLFLSLLFETTSFLGFCLWAHSIIEAKKKKKLAIEIQCAPFFLFYFSHSLFFFFWCVCFFFKIDRIFFFFRRCCSSQ